MTSKEESYIKENTEYIKDAMSKGWTFEEAIENRRKELMADLYKMTGINPILGE